MVAGNTFQQRDEGKNSAAMFVVTPEEAKQKEADNADQTTRDRHSRLMERLNDEETGQYEERYQMAVDEDFYDSLQWTAEDAQILLDRGQAPLVFNHCKTRVNWVTGTQKRTRVDFKVLPRKNTGSNSAEVKSKVLKYLGDVNNIQMHRSAAFEDMVIAGLGWLEDGASTDPSQEVIYSGRESWRNVWRDRRSRQFDEMDARYKFRKKKVDTDIAVAVLPKAAGLIQSASTDASKGVDWDEEIWYLGERVNAASMERMTAGGSTRFGPRAAYISTAMADNGRREMTELIECWYRVPEQVKFLRGGEFDGRRFEVGNERHAWEIGKGFAQLDTNPAMTMRVMIATKGACLWDGPSPYRHQRFSLTPIWCYRRRRDGSPYGVIRDVRDAQEDLNKRRSKALFILSSTTIKMEKGAVEDVNVARDEASRPDGVIEVKKGTVFEFVDRKSQLEGNLELMQEDAAYMEEGSGVTNENLGRKTNATSGVAIEARQDQGSVVTAGLFDNLRIAQQLQGQIQLSLAEQYMSKAKVIRVVGDNQPVEWLQINHTDPDTGETINDITAEQADYVVSEQDYRATYRQAMFDSFGELLGKLAPTVPGLAAAVLDLVVELSDVPNKDEFLARIRKITGQRDPTKELTPEDKAAMAQQAQEQQQEKAMKQAAAVLAIKKIQAEVDKLGAQAGQASADALGKTIAAIVAALEGGGMVVAAPAAVPAADEILQGAGFHDQGGGGLDMPAPAAVPAPAPPMAAMPPQPVPPPPAAAGGLSPTA